MESGVSPFWPLLTGRAFTGSSLRFGKSGCGLAGRPNLGIIQVPPPDHQQPSASCRCDGLAVCLPTVPHGHSVGGNAGRQETGPPRVELNQNLSSKLSDEAGHKAEEGGAVEPGRVRTSPTFSVSDSSSIIPTENCGAPTHLTVKQRQTIRKCNVDMVSTSGWLTSHW